MSDLFEQVKAFTSLEVIGGFNIVGTLGNEGFIEISCSCGWRMPATGITDGEAVEAAVYHNATHKNLVKVKQRFLEKTFTYQEAMHFLIMLGMDEEKAETYLDNSAC